jgi:ADP-ribosylation factor 2-binding protein
LACLTLAVARLRARPRAAPRAVDQSEPLEGVLDAEELGEAEEDILFSAFAPADEFDLVLGTLEDVMMDDGFNEKIDRFMRQHCGTFESADENKHEYMELFNEYMALLEQYIQAKMSAALPGFDMAALCALIKRSGSDLNIDLEALGAYGDFEAFKQMMVSYRQEVRLGDAALSLTGEAVRVWREDDEDGLPMPELTLSISSPTRGVLAQGASAA